MSSSDFIRQDFFILMSGLLQMAGPIRAYSFRIRTTRHETHLRSTFVTTANLQKGRSAKAASVGITQLLLSVMVDVEQIDDIEPASHAGSNLIRR